MNIEAIIYYPGADDEMKIVGYYTPPCPGKRDEFGAQLEPDEGDSIEVVSASINGVACELDSEQKQDAIAALWEAVSESE